MSGNMHSPPPCVQVTVVAIATRMRSDWSEASKSSSSHSIHPQQLPPFLSEELMFTMEGGSEGPCVSRNSVVSINSNEELSPPKVSMVTFLIKTKSSFYM